MLSIIVPYRDREDHLKQFLPHMKRVCPHFSIVIVEQADNKEFNRGKLINIGYLEAGSLYFIAHDVDLLGPSPAYNHRSEIRVHQLCASDIQKVDYLGGATLYFAPLFEKAGGYHNDYFHRAEDNEMMFNLKRKRINVTHWNYEFINLPHPRTGPEFIPELWQKAQLPRTVNMLETCNYSLISKEVHETHTHIKVAL